MKIFASKEENSWCGEVNIYQEVMLRHQNILGKSETRVLFFLLLFFLDVIQIGGVDVVTIDDVIHAGRLTHDS